ncbi:MAG: rRNA ((1408)-N(1))-methyltransferase [Acidimicrobiaceae bacterium]|jgi:16S rRNA (adenine(1408)-N(1))-methyltransferase|nr:rRNA ((1408)-N(1))-methyltransferase [Acidimicrobiaceae bacterium]
MIVVVEGKRRREMDAAELAERMSSAGTSRVVIDVGTGDGRFAYAYASAHPDAFVVGVDAIAERLEELSAKAARKPAKGGRPNVVFVRATVEDLPSELTGVADEVHVLLPWGALLVGAMLAEAPVMAGIAGLAKPGAEVVVVFNAEVWEDSTPKDMADLPAVTVDYVRSWLAPRYAAFGLDVLDAHELSPDEVGALSTTWARKLAHGRHPKFVHLRARRASPRPPAP